MKVATAPESNGPEFPAVAFRPPSDSPATASPAQPSSSQGPWLRWVRYLMLALCLLAGALFAWDTDEILIAGVDARLVGSMYGFMRAVILVHVFGLLGWVVMRGLLRRQAWTYKRVTYSPLLLSLVLVGILSLPVSRAQHLNSPVDEATDPVGMKLAGQSAQLSRSDTSILLLHSSSPLSKRFSTMTSKVAIDYDDQQVTREAWVASTRRRLRVADRVLSGLQQRTAEIADKPVRRQLQRMDRRRRAVLTAFSRLLAAVNASATSDVRSALVLINSQVRALRREARRLWDLMEPYMTDKRRREVEQALDRADDT